MATPPVSISSRPPLTSLLMLLGLILACVILVPVVGGGIVALLYGPEVLSGLRDPLEHPELRSAFLLLQAISSAGLVIVPLIYLRYTERVNPAVLFPLPKRPLMTLVLLALIGTNFAIAISPVVEWNASVHFPSFMKGFEEWARQQEDLATKVTDQFTQFKSSSDLFIGLVVIALIPGIGEELVFRGLFQNEFRRWSGNPHVAIWTAAILFSAIHVQFFGFVPRVLLGALFGYLYYWSGSLWVPMFAHFFHNGFTVVMLYLHQHGQIAMDINNDAAAPWSAVFVTGIFVVVLLTVFRRIQTEQT